MFQNLGGETGPEDQVCDANKVRITEGECDGERNQVVQFALVRLGELLPHKRHKMVFMMTMMREFCS